MAALLPYRNNYSGAHGEGAETCFFLFCSRLSKINSILKLTGFKMNLSKKTYKRLASLCLRRGPLLPAARLLGVQVPPITVRSLSRHIPWAEQS